MECCAVITFYVESKRIITSENIYYQVLCYYSKKIFTYSLNNFQMKRNIITS